MERSELVAEALGEHVFEWFLRNKRAEWGDYKTQVTQFELDRYLPSLVTDPMEPLLVYPDPPPPELAQALDLGGYPWKAVGRRAGRRPRAEPDDGWARRHRRRRRRPRGRVRAVPGAAQARPARSSRCCCSSAARSSADLELRDDLFDDFCLDPFQPRELEARLKHLFWRTGRGTRPELVEYGDARAQPRDLPGRHRRPAARPHLHGVRAAEVPRHAPGQGVHPRDAAVAGCGATSTTAAPARSTSTSGACGPSSARSTPT